MSGRRSGGCPRGRSGFASRRPYPSSSSFLTAARISSEVRSPVPSPSLSRARLMELLADLLVLERGHHQDRYGSVGLVQLPNQFRSALVGQTDVHDGGVYADFRHLLATLGHLTCLRDDLQVRFVV